MEYEQWHLLVESGRYGMSFAWYRKNPLTIDGLAVYNFEASWSKTEIVEEMKKILLSDPVYKGDYLTVTYCADFNESLLIPAEFHKIESGRKMLDLLYASGDESNFRSEEVTNRSLENMYAVDKDIASLLTEKFPHATTFHSTSLQLKPENPAGNQLHCIFHNGSLKVFLFHNGSIQLVQYFLYSTPADVAYHLLNCCEQYNIRCESVHLTISGMIDRNSGVFNELNKYFLHINFDTYKQNIQVAQRICHYPDHFFSHLTDLAACVS